VYVENVKYSIETRSRNIIFYVRESFYDKEFDPYEILDKETFKILSDVIKNEANDILKDYNLTLNDIMNVNIYSIVENKDIMNVNIYSIVENKDMALDILCATELID